MDIATLDRRRALWNAKCRCGGPFSMCQCIAACENCGHVKADHDYSGDEIKSAWGGCEVDDCTCGRFVEDDND